MFLNLSILYHISNRKSYHILNRWPDHSVCRPKKRKRSMSWRIQRRILLRPNCIPSLSPLSFCQTFLLIGNRNNCLLRRSLARSVSLSGTKKRRDRVIRLDAAADAARGERRWWSETKIKMWLPRLRTMTRSCSAQVGSPWSNNCVSHYNVSHS